jgi:DNA (cytosine-5)-methyltransferase 1
MMGGGVSMAITCSFLPNIAEPQIGAMRGRNPDSPNERKKSNGRYKQRLEMNENGISNTLTSVYKDNVVVEPKVQQVGNLYPDTEEFKNRTMGRVYSEEGISPTINCCGGGDREPKLKVPQATAQGYAECELGGIFDASYINSATRRGRVQDGGKISPALTSEGEPLNRWEGGYRIRKLTPRECFRLMDVDEHNIDKIQNYKDPMSGKAISNSQQYKGAGNSICVNPMYLTFKSLFYPPVRIQLTIFDIL